MARLPSAASAASSPVENLVREGLPLVRGIVRATLVQVPPHVSAEDLTSAGLTALVLAAQAFDPERSASFFGYASRRIRGAVLDELRALDWASRSVRRRGRQVDQARLGLAAELGRPPSDGELAAALGIRAEDVDAHRRDVARAVVLPLHSLAEGAVEENPAARPPTPVDVLEHREEVAYLQDAVAALPERLRAVVQGCFFEERPMSDIAADLGVSESRVSQMRAEACSLVRDALNSALQPELVTAARRPAGCAARRRETYFAQVAARRPFRSRLAPTAEELPPLRSRTARRPRRAPVAVYARRSPV